VVLLVSHVIMTKGKCYFYERVLEASSIECWWDQDVDTIFNVEESSKKVIMMHPGSQWTGSQLAVILQAVL